MMKTRVLLVMEREHGRTFQTVTDRGKLSLVDLGCRV